MRGRMMRPPAPGRQALFIPSEGAGCCAGASASNDRAARVACDSEPTPRFGPGIVHTPDRARPPRGRAPPPPGRGPPPRARARCGIPRAASGARSPASRNDARAKASTRSKRWPRPRARVEPCPSVPRARGREPRDWDQLNSQMINAPAVPAFPTRAVLEVPLTRPGPPAPKPEPLTPPSSEAVHHRLPPPLLRGLEPPAPA